MKKHKSQSESQAKVAEEDEQKKFMQKIIDKYSRKQDKADSAKIKGDQSRQSIQKIQADIKRIKFIRKPSDESNGMSLYSGFSFSKRS